VLRFNIYTTPVCCHARPVGEIIAADSSGVPAALDIRRLRRDVGALQDRGDHGERHLEDLQGRGHDRFFPFTFGKVTMRSVACQPAGSRPLL
jgi:hypothetical protein